MVKALAPFPEDQNLVPISGDLRLPVAPVSFS